MIAFVHNGNWCLASAISDPDLVPLMALRIEAGQSFPNSSNQIKRRK